MTILKKLLFAGLIILLSSSLFAQGGPPDPPDNPNAGGGPIGGSAPVGDGIAALLILSSAYAAIKYSRSKNKKLKEIADVIPK
jgi:hypothetical protein